MSNIIDHYIEKGIIQYQANFIHIDEDKLDLLAYNTAEYYPFQANKNIKPFSDLIIVCLDIETTGKNPKVDEIKMVGLISSKGKMVCDDGSGDEATMITNLFYILQNMEMDIFATYNGISFDIDFVIERAKLYNITDPFYKSNYPTTIMTAQINGKPITYYGYWLKNKHREHIAVIDLYHQTLIWDFTFRKLTNYSLKSVPVEMGLRSKDDRLTLSYKELLEEYASGDLTRVKQYLEDDLTDTLGLANFLIPAIYYQKILLPDWSLQKLSTKGGGSKWNTILKDKYIELMQYALLLDVETSDKTFYQGGYTEGNAGLFFNFCKIDVASLYPSLMLIYGITTRKDTLNVLLGILSYLRDERIVQKALGKKGNIEAKQLDGSLKIFINTAYGLFATMGLDFNDFEAAALVTAYGRAILKLMRDTILANGGTIAGLDTDGAYYSCDNQEENQRVYKLVCDAMPNGINIDYEMTGRCLFIPPVDDKSTLGLKKNYIIFNYDGTHKAVGRYRKRDKCKLEKEFQIQYITRLLNDGRESADKYYRMLIKKIRQGKLSLDAIRITRTAKSNEKSVFERGLVGTDGKCTYFIGDDIKVMKTKTKQVQVKINEGTYSAEFYIDMVKTQMKEIERFIPE